MSWRREEKEFRYGFKRTREEEFAEDEKRRQPKKAWQGPEKNSPFFVCHNFICDYLKFPLPPNAEEREYLKNCDENGFLKTTERQDYPWLLGTTSRIMATFGEPVCVLFNPVVLEAYVRPPACNLILRWQENFCEIRHPQFSLEVRFAHREFKSQHYLAVTQLSFFNSDPEKIFILEHKEVGPGNSFAFHHSDFGVRSGEVFACILHDLWSNYRAEGIPDHFQVEFMLIGLLNTARNQVVVELNPLMCKDCLTLHHTVDRKTLTCPLCQLYFNQ